MRTIRFNTDDPQFEEALRVITFSGQVVHTGEFGVYRVPNDTLALLDEKGITYTIMIGRDS